MSTATVRTVLPLSLGAWIQLGLCGSLLVGAATSTLPFAAVVVFWAGFCGALGVRGPPAFGDALTLPPAQLGRASALLVLALLGIGSLGTQGVAPFMAGDSVVPLAAAMMVMLLASIGLVLPYPPLPPATPAPTDSSTDSRTDSHPHPRPQAGQRQR